MPRSPAGYEEIRPGRKGFHTYNDSDKHDAHLPIKRGETSRSPLRNRGWVQTLIVVFSSLIFFGMGTAVGRRFPRGERKWGMLGKLFHFRNDGWAWNLLLFKYGI